MGMRFEDERYVRLYTRVTVTTKKIGWEGRAVLRELFTRVDRAGILSLSTEDPVEAIVLLGEMPHEVVKTGLDALLRAETVHWLPEHDCLFIPRFLEAQEATSSNALRQKIKRERAKAREALNVLEADKNPRKATLSTPVHGRSRDTNRVDGDTGRVDGDTNRVGASAQLKPETVEGSSPRETRDVSPTTRNGSPTTRNGSGATQSDLLKPSLPKADPIASSPAAGGRGTSSPISRDEWEPSRWLMDQASELGLSKGTLWSVVEEYRKNGKSDFLLPTQHDKCFVGFLKAAKQRNGGRSEGTAAATGGGHTRPTGATGGRVGRYGGDREQAASERARARLDDARRSGKL